MEYGLPATTAREVVAGAARTAVLPVGSFEQHGSHLPLATDTLIANILATEISSKLNLMLLPPITYGCSHEHADWLGTISISARTMQSIVNDISLSLRASGNISLLVVNGHGGNYVLSNVVQEASVEGPLMELYPQPRDWEAARRAAGIGTSGHEDMHAGELETSILLNYEPSVVRSDYASHDHVSNNRPHLLSLGMRPYTESGVIGRPSQATPEKGKAVIDFLVEGAEAFVSVLE